MRDEMDIKPDGFIKEEYEKPKIETYTEEDILEKFEVSALTF